MITKLFDIYIDITFRFLAYGIGYLLLAFTYPVAFILPPLKRMLKEYKRIGSYRSVFWVTFSAVITMMLVFVVIEELTSNDPFFNLKYYFISFIIWMFFGFLALFFLADYKRKHE